MVKLEEFNCKTTGDRLVLVRNSEGINVIMTKQEYREIKAERRERFSSMVTSVIVVGALLYFGGHILVSLMGII
jgi:hypothetical protein